jgi:uncharacterized protein YqeY
MSKMEEFNNALKTAMKSGDAASVSAIRLIVSAVKAKTIDSRGTGKEFTDADILSLMQGMIKQRNESLKIYRDNKREDLAAKEEEEIQIIQRFLPQQMDDAATDKVIGDIIASTGAAGVKDMGKVMAELKTRYAGQIDMAKAGPMVKAKLGG